MHPLRLQHTAWSMLLLFTIHIYVDAAFRRYVPPAHALASPPAVSPQLLASTVLRSEVGRRSLAVLLADRVGLAGDIKVTRRTRHNTHNNT